MLFRSRNCELPCWFFQAAVERDFFGDPDRCDVLVPPGGFVVDGTGSSPLLGMDRHVYKSAQHQNAANEFHVDCRMAQTTTRIGSSQERKRRLTT